MSKEFALIGGIFGLIAGYIFIWIEMPDVSFLTAFSPACYQSSSEVFGKCLKDLILGGTVEAISASLFAGFAYWLAGMGKSISTI